MPRPDLDAIRKRRAGITPPPWFCGTWSGVCQLTHAEDQGWHGKGKCRYLPRRFDGEYFDRYIASETRGKNVISLSGEELVISPEDSLFISHAPTDIAALLAYVDELEEERERARASYRAEMEKEKP